MDLYTHAEELGAGVRYTECMSRWGRYDSQSHTIWLLAGMGATQWRTTLAHECGHAYWRHASDGLRQERQADVYAVGLLIPPECWAWASASVQTPQALAHELNVLPRLVHLAHTIYQDSTFCGN